MVNLGLAGDCLQLVTATTVVLNYIIFCYLWKLFITRFGYLANLAILQVHQFGDTCRQSEITLIFENTLIYIKTDFQNSKCCRFVCLSCFVVIFYHCQFHLLLRSLILSLVLYIVFILFCMLAFCNQTQNVHTFSRQTTSCVQCIYLCVVLLLDACNVTRCRHNLIAL